MVNFSKIHFQNLVADGKSILYIRFGSEKPSLDTICHRCKRPLGKHYGGYVIYCPDQWANDRPHLASLMD